VRCWPATSRTRAADIDAVAAYRQRYAEWQRRYLYEGATRAYPYAWRLPEAARRLGAKEHARAQHALVLTLYCLGRYAEAERNLPDPACLDARAATRCTGLTRRCAWLQGRAVAGVDGAGDLVALSEAAQFDWLRADITALSARLPAYRQAARGQAIEAACCEVLDCWLRAAAGEGFAPAAAQTALAELRSRVPAMAASAEAVLAEAAFRHAPRWSVVWLDAALDSCERFAQHHCQARLLVCKAGALQAAGALREAERFEALAGALAARQGDQRVLALAG
jgi:hypothetical protein